MPRKAAAAATVGEEAMVVDQAAPRRSTRIAAQPKTEEVQPAPKRATKKRTAEDAAVPETAEEGDEDKGKAKKAKGDSSADDNAEESGEGSDATAAAIAPIDIGGTLPNLTLKNEKDEDIQIADIANEKGVVIFLVPKADTPGCTTQACGFRDIFAEFTAVNYAVYCLSADSSSAQTKWQSKKELPYSLISDPKRILITALGAGEGGKTKRSHFIFKKGGELVEKKIPVKPADSPNLALEFIKSTADSS